MVAPLPNRDLQPEHLDAIQAFVSETTAPDTSGARPDAEAGPDALEIVRRLLGDTV